MKRPNLKSNRLRLKARRAVAPFVRIKQYDPSRTTALRRQMDARLTIRFAMLKGLIHGLIVHEDALGLKTSEVNALTVNPFVSEAQRKAYAKDDPDWDCEEWDHADKPTTNRWQFKSSPAQLKAFHVWIKKQLDEVLIGKSEEEIWDLYIQKGFHKGAGRSFDEWHEKHGERWGRGKGKFYDGTRTQFMRDSFAQPVDRDRVKILASRTFTDLKNTTRDMATRMGRSLVDGLIQGKGADAIARDLDADLDLGRNRARTIARTELIRAHAEGQLHGMEKLGVSKIGVAVEWMSTEDSRMCPLCGAMDGKIFTVEDAHGLIPKHPNCRCAFKPVFNYDPTDLEDPDTSDEPVGNNFRGGINRITGYWRAVDSWTLNVFCPTGPGGGIDPTCSPGGLRIIKTDYSSADKKHLTETEQKEFGKYYAERSRLNKKIREGKATDEDRIRHVFVKTKLDEFSKLVKERKAGGRVIEPPPPIIPSITKPEPKPEPPSTKPPVNEINEQYFARIRLGVLTESKKVKDELDAARAKFDKLVAEVKPLGAASYGSMTKEQLKEYNSLSSQIQTIQKESAARIHATLALPKDQQNHNTLSSNAKDPSLGPAGVKIREAEKFIQSMYKPPADAQYKVNYATHPDGYRANHSGRGDRFFVVAESTVNMGKKDSAEAVIHELGHALEYHNEKVLAASLAFLDRRCAGELSRPLNEILHTSSFRPDEKGREDDFRKAFGRRAAYVGKDYGRRATEVLSMGIQEMWSNPANFALTDPDYFDHVIGVMHGRIGR